MSFSNFFSKPAVRAQSYDNCTNAPRPRQLAGAACISPCPRLRAPRPSGLPAVARNSSEVPHNRATGLGSHSYRRNCTGSTPDHRVGQVCGKLDKVSAHAVCRPQWPLAGTESFVRKSFRGCPFHCFNHVCIYHVCACVCLLLQKLTHKKSPGC